MVGKAIARFAAIGPIVPLVALWYLSATMAVTSSRSVLQATGLPFCLSAAQFTISSFLSRWVLQYGLPWFTGGVYKPMLRDLSLDRPERKFVRSIALTYTLGFVFTNISLALCNASFSETVKSAEPISSLALAAMTRGEDSVTTLEWLTTLPIVLGVALSSYGDASFHAFGFFAAFASNFMFSMRGLNTKQLRRLYGTPHGLDDMHLFYHISKFGAALVVPVALVLEGPSLLRMLLGYGPVVASAVVSAAQATVTQAAAAAGAGDGTGGGGALAAASASVADAAAAESSSASAGLGTDASQPGVPEVVLSLHRLGFWQLLRAVLFNGCCYCCYNQTSFVVLGRVSFVTHATLNVMRRTCIIVATAWWFGVSMHPTNVIGIALALSGFTLFLCLKANGSPSLLSVVTLLPLVGTMVGGRDFDEEHASR